jgi:hypothetical protein
MIFLSCIRESLVQVNDKTRIDVSKSFVSGSGITAISIKPEASGAFIPVYNSNQAKWFLDWAYATSGTKVVTVQATDGVSTVSQNFELEVITEASDNLYSSDEQIFSIESELKRYIPDGKNSFKNIHREAQSRILNYLDRKRIWASNGEPYTKDQVNLNGELSKWSLYEAMFIIYSDLFVSVGDKFAEKINQYKDLRNSERDRASIRIDKDNSGTFDSNEEIQDLKSFRMIRR